MDFIRKYFLFLSIVILMIPYSYPPLRKIIDSLLFENSNEALNGMLVAITLFSGFVTSQFLGLLYNTNDRLLFSILNIHSIRNNVDHPEDSYTKYKDILLHKYMFFVSSYLLMSLFHIMLIISISILHGKISGAIHYFVDAIHYLVYVLFIVNIVSIFIFTQKLMFLFKKNTEAYKVEVYDMYIKRKKEEIKERERIINASNSNEGD